MAIINIIVWLLGISFIIMLFVIAYKAAIEDGSPGCLYALIAAAIIIIIILAVS
jgi:hypothetical protein